MRALPRHVTGTVVEDADTVVRLLSPFAGTPVDSAVITRHELLGLPSRPDAGVSYYYSALPFNWSDNDWSTVYAALAASPVPVVLSVARAADAGPGPVRADAADPGHLLRMAGPRGRDARRPVLQGAAVRPRRVRRGRGEGLPRLLPADSPRRRSRCGSRCPPRSTCRRASSRPSPTPSRRRGTPTASSSTSAPPPPTTMRRPASVAERRLAEYNLNVINFGMLTGRPEIWSRPDPPDPQLAMLSVLGDARDAACAFRFPIAADGIVPGFRVRRGQFRQVAAKAPDGPVIRIGKVAGTDKDIAVSLRSLTKHALIAGSAWQRQDQHRG